MQKYLNENVFSSVFGDFLPQMSKKDQKWGFPPTFFFIGLSGGSGLPDKRPIRNVKPAKGSFPLHYTVKNFSRRSRENFFALQLKS